MAIVNVEKQLSFYGAYHANKWNILVHIFFVPLILWSAQVFVAHVTLPTSIVSYKYIAINDYLALETNLATLLTVFYWIFYVLLEPLGAVLYLPQLALSVLSATSLVHSRPYLVNSAIGLHIVAWLAQFASHGFAEKRAPALFDNLLGAVVTGPFFVHLEILFFLGYKPELHRRIQNLTGIEIARVRREEASKKRAKAQ